MSELSSTIVQSMVLYPAAPPPFLHRFPIEILGVIFQLVLAGSDTFWGRIKTALALSQIDHQLREIACKTPLLWVTLACPPLALLPTKKKRDLIYLLRLLASRSGGAPLHIDARQINFQDLSSLLKVVCQPQQASRWQKFRITYEDRSSGKGLVDYRIRLKDTLLPLSLLLEKRPRMGHLTHLIINQTDPRGVSPGLFGKPWRLPTAPNLSILQVVNANIDWLDAPIYPALTEVTLDNPLFGCGDLGGTILTGFLERQPSITTLKLLGSFDTISAPIDPFAMYTLLDLHLMIDGPFNADFIFNLTSPSLGRLSVRPSLKAWSEVHWDNVPQLRIGTVEELTWNQVTEEDFEYFKETPVHQLLAANISSNARIRLQ